MAAPVKVEITGDATGLSGALAKVQGDLKGFAGDVNSMTGGLGKAFDAIKAPMLAIAGIFGGAAFLKSTVEETKNWTVEAMKLSRVLGITTESASVLNLAIGDIYGTMDEFLPVVAKITKTLNSDEDAFKRLGVATRDTNGHLRPTTEIIADVNTKLAAMKAGTDRNVASAQIYGKGWLEVQRYLGLTTAVMDEAQAKAERLNLIVGADAVKATKDYRASVNDLEDTIKGLKIRAGTELMPVLTALNKDMAETGPAAVGFLAKSFRVLYEVIYALRGQFEIFLISAESLFDLFVLKAATAFKQSQALAVLNFKEIAILEAEYQAKSYKIAYEGAARIAEVKDRYASEAMGVMGFGSKDDKPGGGGDNADTAAAAAARKAAEAAAKAAADKAKRLADEAAKQAAADAALFAKQQAADEEQSKKIFDIRIARKTQHKLAELKIEQDYNENLRQQGLISEDELIQRTMVLEDRRLEIENTSLQQRLNVANLEPVERARINSEIQAAQDQHNQAMSALAMRLEAEQQRGNGGAGFVMGIKQYLEESQNAFQNWKTAALNVMQGVEGAFATGINGLLSGQMKLGQAMKSIWKGITDTVVQALSQMVAKWIVGKIAAMLFGDTVTESSQAAAVAQQEAAAAGIFAAHSAIPFVGPAIAAGLVAVMNAALIANAASAKGIVGAAEGGWFDRPTLTMIGEGARPELVVPDTSFRDFALGLSQSILAQERQAQDYRLQAARFTTQAPAGARGGGDIHIHGNVIPRDTAEWQDMIADARKGYDQRNG